MNIPSILKKCSALEADIADIYRKFSGLYPEMRDLWDDIAAEEDGHAATLMFASKFAEKGQLPNIVPHKLITYLEGTVDMVEAVKGMIGEDALTLDDALGMALNLEQTVHENYLFEIMRIEFDSDVLDRLKLIATETESHASRIKQMMEIRRK